MFAPAATLADTNLEVGGEAVVAYANGDNVRFREKPDYGGAVLDMVPEGTMVDVFYGPITADDGSIWYNVGVDGEPGYILADFLAVPDGSGGSVPANATVLDAEGSASADGIAAGTVVSIAVIAGTNGDGVRCRNDASSGAAVITVLPEGTSVELTGDAIGEWQPVNCAGQGGFVHAEFVSFDGSGVGTDTSSDNSTDTVAAASDSSEGATFGAASVTGTALVGDTQGDGLRCRVSASFDAKVVAVFREGSTLNLRGDAQDGWQPVVCRDTNGYVSAQYVDYDGSSASDDAEVSAADVNLADNIGGSTGVATIGDTQGDGLRCRSRATYSASVITVLSEGSTVDLAGNASGVWQPVICGGTKGWVHTDYLIYDGGASGNGDDSVSGSSNGGSDSVTGTAYVGDTQGDGLRCRSAASFNSSIIAVLSEGSKLQLRGDASNGWQPVLCNGSKGFVSADYVSYNGGGSTSGGSSSGDGGGDSSGGSSSGFSSGDTVEVSGTNGDGVRFRSSASSSGAIISVLSEGTVLKVRSGSSGSWVAVKFSGSNGFVHSDYLIASDGSSGSSNGGSTSGGSSSGSGNSSSDFLSDGDHAVTSASLNLRYDPSYSAGVAAVAPSGTVVLITGSSSNGFYPVDWDGLSGYMHGDYLSATNADLSERGGSGTPANGNSDGVSGGGGGSSGGSSGSAIVNYAMQYLGYPYVWATHGPSSFDCSGFTYWVTLNTLGIDIGTGTFSQASAGRSVSRSDLQPGDLVFFQNTYTWGLSHVGIYIGNDQFIHAENETTGVKISSLSSDYYSSRWYGAVRLT